MSMDRARPEAAAHVRSGLSEDFRLAMRQTAATVCAVSVATSDGEWRGSTVNSMISVSLSPPSLLVSLNGASRIHAAVLSSRRFVVTIFAEEQAEIAACFASPELQAERFGHGSWRAGPEGLPFLEGAVANITCSAAELLPFSTHTIIVGAVESVTRGGGIRPLVYHDGRYGGWHVIPAETRDR